MEEIKKMLSPSAASGERLAEGEPIADDTTVVKIEDIPRNEKGYPLLKPIDHSMV